MLNLENSETIAPLCPHCSTELQTVLYRELRGVLGKRYIYFCPTCRKTLGDTPQGFLDGLILRPDPRAIKQEGPVIGKSSMTTAVRTKIFYARIDLL